MDASGSKVSCTLANRYHKRIWVKCEVEPTSNIKQHGVGGAFGGIGVAASVSKQQEYDWAKIGQNFSPIPSYEYLEFTVDCKDSNIIYVTIIDDDRNFICDKLGIKYTKLVVTEAGLLRAAHPDNCWKEHPRYQNRPKTKTSSM